MPQLIEKVSKYKNDLYQFGNNKILRLCKNE